MPLLAAALALAFWRVGLWSRGLPLVGHVLFLAHPLITQATRQLQAGSFPLWNPYAYCGIPLLADPQAEVLNPAHVLFRVFPFATAFKLDLAVDVVLACVLTYALARRFGARRSSGALAGLLASCGGFLYYHSPMVAQADALVWIPGIILFWSAGAAMALGLALALCYFGGNPFFVYIALAGCLAIRPRRRPLGTAAAAAALALALASPQLLPALELFRQSTRPGPVSAAAALVYSVPPRALLKQLLEPLWNRSAAAFVGDPTITSFYVGLPALGLAVWGALRRRPGVAAAVFWSAGGLLLTLGGSTPLYPALLKLAPGLSLFRFPAQWGALAGCGLAILAALGADRLKRRWRLLGFALVALDLWLFLGEAPTARVAPDFFPLKPATLAAAQAGPRVAHTAALLDAQAGAVADGDLERYWLAQKEGLVPSHGTVFGLREVLSYNLYEPRSTHGLLRACLTADARCAGLLRFLGVGALIDGSPRAGYRVLTLRAPALPLVTWVSSARVLPDEQAAAYLASSSFDPEKEVVLAVAAPAAGYQVWAGTYYPGWRAFVDGREAQVLRANLGFRAVGVGAGGHDVRWVYRSRFFGLGLALALGVLLAAAISSQQALALSHPPTGRRPGR